MDVVIGGGQASGGDGIDSGIGAGSGKGNGAALNDGIFGADESSVGDREGRGGVVEDDLIVGGDGQCGGGDGEIGTGEVDFVVGIGGESSLREGEGSDMFAGIAFQRAGKNAGGGVGELQVADAVGKCGNILAVDFGLAIRGDSQGCRGDGEIGTGEADSVVGVGGEGSLGNRIEAGGDVFAGVADESAGEDASGGIGELQAINAVRESRIVLAVDFGLAVGGDGEGGGSNEKIGRW